MEKVGTVCDLMPGPLEEAAVVVALDYELEVVGRTGRRCRGKFLVLEPAGVASRWRQTGKAHVEVCAELPAGNSWLDRTAGVWVDSDADYEFS